MPLELVEDCDVYLNFDDGATWPTKFEFVKLSNGLALCFIDLSGVDKSKLTGAFFVKRDNIG